MKKKDQYVVHIGDRIKEVIKTKSGKTIKQVGSEMQITPSGFYDLLGKPHINSHRLLEISRCLQHNFILDLLAEPLVKDIQCEQHELFLQKNEEIEQLKQQLLDKDKRINKLLDKQFDLEEKLAICEVCLANRKTPEKNLPTAKTNQ